MAFRSNPTINPNAAINRSKSTIRKSCVHAIGISNPLDSPHIMQIRNSLWQTFDSFTDRVSADHSIQDRSCFRIIKTIVGPLKYKRSFLDTLAQHFEVILETRVNNESWQVSRIAVVWNSIESRGVPDFNPFVSATVLYIGSEQPFSSSKVQEFSGKNWTNKT